MALVGIFHAFKVTNVRVSGTAGYSFTITAMCAVVPAAFWVFGGIQTGGVTWGFMDHGLFPAAYTELLLIHLKASDGKCHVVLNALIDTSHL